MKLFVIAAVALVGTAPAVAQHTVVTRTTSTTTHVVDHDGPHYRTVCHTRHYGHRTKRVCTRVRY